MLAHPRPLTTSRSSTSLTLIRWSCSRHCGRCPGRCRSRRYLRCHHREVHTPAVHISIDSQGFDFILIGALCGAAKRPNRSYCERRYMCHVIVLSFLWCLNHGYPITTERWRVLHDAVKGSPGFLLRRKTSLSTHSEYQIGHLYVAGMHHTRFFARRRGGAGGGQSMRSARVCPVDVTWYTLNL